jgi:serine/threonine protein kinase
MHACHDKEESCATWDVDERLDFSAALMRERVRATLLGRPHETVRVGRFEVLRAIGRGGEGLVYECLDSDSQWHVALKCLHSVRGRHRARLQREFRALRHVVHPNLVAMHELFCIDQRWFFTMELVRGVDVVHYVRARPDPAEATRAVVRQLLSALAALHAAGLVHRDIKPSNALVEPNGRVVLLDFGLVIPEASAAQLHGGPGTPAYMAPEQRAGRAPGPKADVYGVGAILFELRTGATFNARRAELGRPSLQVHEATLPRTVARDDELDALCRELLAVDPAGRPSAEQALSRLSGGLPSTAAVSVLPSARPTCFVARGTELTRLHSALFEVSRTGPRIVLVHGESGIGKSALLARFTEQVRARSTALVFSGRCYERESTPYKVFDELVAAIVLHLSERSASEASALTEGVGEPLRQIFPSFKRQLPPRSSDDTEESTMLEPAESARRHAFAALRELLVRLALDTPIVLSIDDLQWGDVDSVLLLEALFAPHPSLPLLLVGTYRRDEAQTSSFLEALLRARVLAPPLCTVEQLALSALTESEALALWVKLAPARLDRGWLESARGVPFLLVEAALAEADLPSAESRQADLSWLFAARLAGLSAPAEALLAVLAVAGRPLSVPLATRASSEAACGFETVLELAARSLIRFRDLAEGRCLEPYHDRIRDHIAHRLGAARRRALHRAIAHAMASLGLDDPLRLVEHLRAGGECGRAAELALHAADRACAQLAWSRAADLLSAALELEAMHDVQALHVRLARVLSYAGRHAEAAAAYVRAGQLPGATTTQSLERLAAAQSMRAGQTAAGLALFERALSRCGLVLPRSELRASLMLAGSRLGALTADALWSGPALPRSSRSARPAASQREKLLTLEAVYRELWLSHPVQSALAHSRYCREARHAGSHERVRALTCEAVVLSLADGVAALPSTQRLLREASQLAEASCTPYEAALLLFAGAISAIHAQWQPRAAIEPLERAAALFAEHCPGTQFEQAWVGLALDHALATTGQLSRCVATVSAREQAEQTGLTRALRVASVPLVLLLAGRATAALELVEAHREASRDSMPLLDWIALDRGASALLYRGEPGEAQRYFERGRRRQGFQLALFCRAVQEGDRYQQARIASALYLTTRDPAQKRKAERLASRAARLPALARAQYRLLEASLAHADRAHVECRALLRSAREDLSRSEGEHGVWCARYREAQLDGSSELQARTRDWFVAQGVEQPESWVSLSIPGATSWT